MQKKTLYTLSVGVAAVALMTVFVLPSQAAKETLTSIGTKIKYFAANGKFPAKHVTYDNAKSGLKAKNVQSALDEVGVTLKEAVTKGTATASGVRATALTGSTWKGYYYTAGASGDDPAVRDTNLITVTFTPTSDTEGTFTSSPHYAFEPRGGSFKGITEGNITTTCDGLYPEATFTGEYEIVGNMLYPFVTSSDSTNTACRESAKASPAFMEIRGNTMIFVSGRVIPQETTILTRQ